MDHYLYCLDAETGAEIWKRKFGGAMAEQPTLDAANGILYVGAFDGKVYAVDAETGEPVEGFEDSMHELHWADRYWPDLQARHQSSG